MREKAEELEDAMVDTRREDRAIRAFEIPMQEDVAGEVLGISSVTVIRDHEVTEKTVDISLYKGQHLLLSGPNGVGKSTLLESIANGKAK